MTQAPASEPWSGPFRKDIIPGLLFLVSLILFATRLSVPAGYMFDEVYHAYTAAQYVAGNTEAYVWDTDAPRKGVSYMWNHPPAGVLLIAGGVRLWGDNSFGWRFSSAVFGAIGVVLAYLLALRLTRDKTVAVVMACLLPIDGLYFAQSRIAMLDIFGMVFAMGALLSFYDYLTAPPDRVRWPLIRIGAMLGLALATKWNAAYLALLTGLVLLYRAWKVWRGTRREQVSPEARSGWKAHLTWLPVSLVVLPVLVYLVSYTPFFATGHDGAQFVELQRQIFVYHTGLEAGHKFQSSWWQWPLALGPVWYWGTFTKDTVAHVFANGNLVLHWAFVPAVSWLALRWRRESNPGLTVLLIGFFGQWLPWALSPRIAFGYHFLPSVPFGALAVAMAVVELYHRGGLRRALAVIYMLTVLAYFVFFYPTYSGLPLSREAFELRMWFESWRPR